MLGVLAIGLKESLELTSRAGCYEALDASQKLYRRVR